MCERVGLITSTKNINKTMARMNLLSMVDYEQGRVNDTGLVFTPQTTEQPVIMSDMVCNEYRVIESDVVCKEHTVIESDVVCNEYTRRNIL